ncbi:T9SS type A sorting domain-containing protein [Halpernia frigidisoli]|uniref:Por secretion system C-terminal sorting domain-containing protein n=1 Tax=Halpernia frigidisoli TaxID=1125876 RepID=A0A1I3CQG0_9FLAO|nr:T9SS type A sorting domain-containing protein [Halpernia frigidisoli]SFH76633.1 Por secretion system C-terminal sorting domain-containing protein [Halpernia frigidisoli]
MKKNYLLFIFLAFSFLNLNAQISVARWFLANTSTDTFPISAQSKNNAVLTSAVLNYSGLGTVNDSRGIFTSNNSAAALNISTAPYVSFILKNATTNSIRFDRFVIHALETFNRSVKLQLRSSVNNFATSLGEFTFAAPNYTLTSIDLTGLNTANATVEFRIYYFNAATSIFHPNPGNPGLYGTSDGTPSIYDANYSFSIFAKEVPLAVDDSATKNKTKIKLYPNPSNDYIQITGLNKSEQYKIINSIGAEIKGATMSDNGTIKIRNLSNGVYFLKFDNGETQKFIKK